MTSYESLLGRLKENVETRGDKTAVTFLEPGVNGGKVQKSFTYAELWAETSKVALTIKDQGLKKGDKAVLVYPPSLDFMIAFLSCL